MKARTVFTGLIVVLFFFVIISAQAQTAKPAAPSRQQAADVAARKQFAAYMVDFRKQPDDDQLRGKIIELAKTLKPAPVIPQVARTDFAKATTQVKKASTADDFKAAAKLFEQAAQPAPWYATAYYNAAAAYAKAADYFNAQLNLTLYMAAVRQGVSTEAAEDLQRDLDHQQSLQRFQRALDEFHRNPSDSAREKIIKLAQEMKPEPEIPEEARQHHVTAKALSDSAKKAEDFSDSIAEFKSALLIAPWWSEANHDLTSTQEAARQFDLQRLLEQLRNTKRYSNQDQQIREAIIKIVRAMPAPPPLPEETLRSMARGEAMVKMGGAGSYAAAAQEMEPGVLAAPWLADGYFNLGIVQEKAEMFGQAIQNLRLYLLAAPQSPNANAVQAKIYGLQVMQEEQEKTQSLAGSWRSKGGNPYQVTLEGKKYRIEGGYKQKAEGDGAEIAWHYIFDLEKKGRTLEGSLAISMTVAKTGCNFPNEMVPASGVIRDDFRSLKVDWKQSRYGWTYTYNPQTRAIIACTGVSSLGKEDQYIELVERTR